MVKDTAQFCLPFLCLAKTIRSSVFKKEIKNPAGFWPVGIRFIFKFISAVLAVFVHMTQTASTRLDLLRHE